MCQFFSCCATRDGRVLFTEENSFAIVTPDGAWHEKGRMGWRGIVTDEQLVSDWEAQVREIYLQYPDHLGVVVDLPHLGGES